VCLSKCMHRLSGVADVRKTVTVALLGMILAVSVSSCIPAAAAPVSVIGNILAESITLSAKGTQINKAIVRFKAGSVANFDSLTQILISQPGSYPLRLEIIGPDSQLRAYYDLTVSASSADWTHSQLTRWRNVSFDKPGTYQFTVRVNRTTVAAFPISAGE
jgi:hypothetical protein